MDKRVCSELLCKDVHKISLMKSKKEEIDEEIKPEGSSNDEEWIN